MPSTRVPAGQIDNIFIYFLPCFDVMITKAVGDCLIRRSGQFGRCKVVFEQTCDAWLLQQQAAFLNWLIDSGPAAEALDAWLEG